MCVVEESLINGLFKKYVRRIMGNQQGMGSPYTLWSWGLWRRKTTTSLSLFSLPSNLLKFNMFWLCCAVCGILVSQPRIEPSPLCTGSWEFWPLGSPSPPVSDVLPFGQIWEKTRQLGSLNTAHTDQSFRTQAKWGGTENSSGGANGDYPTQPVMALIC